MKHEGCNCGACKIFDEDMARDAAVNRVRDAAPELLEALRKVRDFTVQYHQDETAEELLDAIATQFKALQETAHAAIAKAEATP